VTGFVPCQKFKRNFSIIALSQFYRTVCTMDMYVIMYCYCSFVPSRTALLTGHFAVFLRTLLLILDIEGWPKCPSSSCCRPPVYPDWSSTGTWSAIAPIADITLPTVINIYLLDKQVDFSVYRRLRIP